MTWPKLTIAPEVAEMITKKDLMALFRTAGHGFRCTACGRTTQPGSTNTASVVAYLPNGGTAALLVRLAHEWCTESGFYILYLPLGPDAGQAWPATAWLRPEADDHQAVILIAHNAGEEQVSGDGQSIDRLSSALLGRGFDLLTHLDAPIPDAEGLIVGVDPNDDGLSVLDLDDFPLWNGHLECPPGWAEIAITSGRVGVVVASGLNLSDVQADYLADLHVAIDAGAAVAATGAFRLDYQPDRPYDRRS